MTDDAPPTEEGPPDEGYVAPDGSSLYVKSNGEWIEFVGKKTALLFLRFKDYGYEGKSIVFNTLDRERAFKIEEGDDISAYDELSVWKDGALYEEWDWQIDGIMSYEGHWRLRRVHEAPKEADAEPGSTPA